MTRRKRSSSPASIRSAARSRASRSSVSCRTDASITPASRSWPSRFGRGRPVMEKYGEKREIIHAMECHHGDYDPTTVEAVLVNAADALSAARPGARREILENYVHRLERLEAIANQMDGVAKSFAIQAGRELRIIVNAEKITDEQSIWLSKDVARKIESELQYPGQIKVTVIREMRAIDYAK